MAATFGKGILVSCCCCFSQAELLEVTLRIEGKGGGALQEILQVDFKKRCKRGGAFKSEFLESIIKPSVSPYRSFCRFPQKDYSNTKPQL